MGWQTGSDTRRSGGGLIKKLLIPSLISLAFFYILLKTVPLKELKEIFSSVSLPELSGAFLLYTLSQVARSLRWKIILKDLSFRDAFLINSANIFLNNLLPARTGELSWFYYAKKLGISLKTSAWSFILGRFYDLLGLFYLFLLSYALLRGLPHAVASTALIAGISLLIPLLRELLPGIGKLGELKEFLRRELSFKLSLTLSTLSTVSFLLKALGVYILALGLLKIDLLTFTFAFAGGELTTILPIHGFMGYGTYEAGFLLPLKGMGFELKEGIKAGFLVHTFLLLSSALWGVLSIWFLHTLSRKSP